MPATNLRVLLLEPHRGYGKFGSSHSWHELVVVLRGRYRSRVGLRAIDLTAGGAVVYPAGCEHLPEPGDGRSLSLVCAMWCNDPDPGQEPLVAEDPSQRMALTASWLYDLHQRPDDPEAAPALLIALLSEVRHRSAADAPADGDPVERMRCLLQANFSKNQHLPNLAALVGLSPTHLNRLFKARYGVTPMQYLRRLRLEAALAQIATREGTLAEIAQRCGLGRGSYLSRVVRRVTGVVPRHIRR